MNRTGCYRMARRPLSFALFRLRRRARWSLPAVRVSGSPRATPYEPTPSARLAGVPDEALVPDTRASLTPAQAVERKLRLLLKGNPLPSRFRITVN
jgi:hypothetical protein